MIIDIDVLIWYLRGNEKAKKAVEGSIPFAISAVTYMELIQGMENKEEFKMFQKQIQKWNTDVIVIAALAQQSLRLLRSLCKNCANLTHCRLNECYY